MPTDPTTPEGEYFRQVFGRPENAAAYLRDVLPPTLAERIDWDCFERVPLPGEPTEQDMGTAIDQLGFRTKLAIMTTARRIRTEGETIGRAETLIELLTTKFGPLPDPALNTIRYATLDQLREWTTRFPTATTLDDLLG
ncbi:hypothetical protein [Nocardia puris]|uniref:Uncharacterized protein n=1 Tax=Nocardia puris TaxID=208602 RepID=A0A366DJN1_9NOCA|nr:hypothetical protein [Nocardia puris]RBO90287.1 hypothetical protein DFR74_106172 [Nocardia puris]